MTILIVGEGSIPCSGHCPDQDMSLSYTHTVTLCNVQDCTASKLHHGYLADKLRNKACLVKGKLQGLAEWTRSAWPN
jgi:hypothetical protein